MGIDQLALHSVQLGYLKILRMGNTDQKNTKEGKQIRGQASISQESSKEQQLCASSSSRSTASNKLQPTDIAFAKEHQNDDASTNQNDTASLQQLTTDSSQNNQQLVTLHNSNDVVEDTPPLLPTVDQKHYTQNVTFQLNKMTSPLISDWFLKPTAGHSAGTIPHNATADSATIQQSTPKSLTNTCHFLVNPRTRTTAASRQLFKRYY
ncbi:hypothetical protein F511_42428 [Dorcoceras hygrometricum]|uniref:Uncharacterized protein n=1 Tax=Dorcoceras hygrometricum TaxID=472368 RepID=A0A2Z7BY66_9LAMI|nr:hypothetical protein F511_42428 [Dorcoceras hygrometricum]